MSPAAGRSPRTKAWIAAVRLAALKAVCNFIPTVEDTNTFADLLAPMVQVISSALSEGDEEKARSGCEHVIELIDLGVKAGVVEKSGSWFSYKGERLGQGRDNVKELLKENQVLAMELETSIRAHFGLAGESPETPLQAPTAEA